MPNPEKSNKDQSTASDTDNSGGLAEWANERQKACNHAFLTGDTERLDQLVDAISNGQTEIPSEENKLFLPVQTPRNEMEKKGRKGLKARRNSGRRRTHRRKTNRGR